MKSQLRLKYCTVNKCVSADMQTPLRCRNITVQTQIHCVFTTEQTQMQCINSTVQAQIQCIYTTVHTQIQCIYTKDQTKLLCISQKQKYHFSGIITVHYNAILSRLHCKPTDEKFGKVFTKNEGVDHVVLQLYQGSPELKRFR
jgi:hypothetical protein